MGKLSFVPKPLSNKDSGDCKKGALCFFWKLMNDIMILRGGKR